MNKERMNKKIMKGAFASGSGVFDGDKAVHTVLSVVSEAYYSHGDCINNGLNEVFRMVLAEENTDNIMLELKTIVDEAFERVSDEILDTFED